MPSPNWNPTSSSMSSHPSEPLEVAPHGLCPGWSSAATHILLPGGAISSAPSLSSQQQSPEGACEHLSKIPGPPLSTALQAPTYSEVKA